MDSVGVQTFTNCLGLLHEVGDVLIRDDDVRRRNGLLLVEPPDVQLVDRLDPRDLFKVMLDITKIDATRGALQENGTAVLDQRQRRDQNHEGDAHADAGVRVEARGRMREPDDGSCDDDAYVVEGIAHDVDHGPHHAEIPSARFGAAVFGMAVLGMRM